MKELEDSLKYSNRGKTPGVDGIGKKFLTRYWELIKVTIYQATRELTDKESMHFFLETGLIKIILKAEKT